MGCDWSDEMGGDVGERIVIDPNVCHGKPCIKGTRIMVSNILNLFAHAGDIEEVFRGYPAITAEDVYAAFRYAAAVVADE